MEGQFRRTEVEDAAKPLIVVSLELDVFLNAHYARV